MNKLDLRLARLIWHSKGQFISILAVVITGLFVFTAMTNASTNLKTSLEDYYVDSNFADVYVELMEIPASVVEKIENEPFVKEFEGRIIFDVPFITDDESEKVNVRIVSVDSELNDINRLYIHEGKRKIETKEVLVIQQFAIARGIEIGDTITLQISGNKIDFIVNGIVSSPEYAYLIESEQSMMPNDEGFGIIFLEETYFSKISGMSGSYNEVIINYHDKYHEDKVEDEIDDIWEDYGVQRVIFKENQLSNSMLTQEIEGLESTSSTIPIIFLIGAGAVLINMMQRMVKNDRLTIGILKAMGYSNRRVLFHYMKYALTIGVVGGIIGTLLGTWLSGYMTQMYLEFFYIPNLRVKVYYINMVFAVIMSSVLCFGAGYFGAHNVLKIAPAEAMRKEPPKKGTRILLERVKFIWNRVSFTWKIVFRNIFREKKKFLLVIFGAAFTLAMMMTVFWMNGFYNTMFNNYYGEFIQSDYTINFSNLLHPNVLKDVDDMIEYEALEGKMEFPFELSRGKEKKIVNIIGVEEDTQIYNFIDVNKNPVTLATEGIVLTSNLAMSLNAEIGDLIYIHNYIPGRDDLYVRVTGIVKQSLGINGYMNLDYMNEVLMGEEVINGAYVISNNEVIEPLSDVKNISSIQTLQDIQDIFYEFVDLMVVSIVFMLVFSGILGFVIIHSTTTMSINERQMEFSSLRVLGFTKAEIFGIILKENFVMSIVGVAFGYPLGIFFVTAVGNSFTSDLYTLNDPITMNQVVLGIVFTIITLSLAQLATYRKIRKLNFIEALKNRTT